MEAQRGRLCPLKFLRQIKYVTMVSTSFEKNSLPQFNSIKFVIICVQKESPSFFGKELCSTINKAAKLKKSNSFVKNVIEQTEVFLLV